MQGTPGAVSIDVPHYVSLPRGLHPSFYQKRKTARPDCTSTIDGSIMSFIPHPMPYLNTLIRQMRGATIFNILDHKSGYWQVYHLTKTLENT